MDLVVGLCSLESLRIEYDGMLLFVRWALLRELPYGSQVRTVGLKPGFSVILEVKEGRGRHKQCLKSFESI